MDAPRSSCSGSCLSRALVVQTTRVFRRLSPLAERFHSPTNYRSTTGAFTRKPVLAAVLLLLFACRAHFALSSTEDIQPSDSIPAHLAQNPAARGWTEPRQMNQPTKMRLQAHRLLQGSASRPDGPSHVNRRSYRINSGKKRRRYSTNRGKKERR